MSVGNSTSVVIYVGNKKTKKLTEFPMDIQTDKNAKKNKFPPPSYRRNILSVNSTVIPSVMVAQARNFFPTLCEIPTELFRR